MKPDNTNSESFTNSIECLTDEQFKDMLEEFRIKACSMHKLFSDLNSRISSILNDPAGNKSLHSITPLSPAASVDDEVRLFKLRELDLDYIIPILSQEVL